MKKAEAASEFSSILRLLREHSFLRYSSTGRQEYDQRLLSASDMFSNLVSQVTGLTLQSPQRYAELDTVSDGSYASLVRTVRKVAVKLRRKPASCSAQEFQRMELMRVEWEKAVFLMSILRD